MERRKKRRPLADIANNAKPEQEKLLDITLPKRTYGGEKAKVYPKDLFDNLMDSPMRPLPFVTFRELSFWEKKVEAIKSPEKKPGLDIYEYPPSEDSGGSKAKARPVKKRRHRKKKADLYDFYWQKGLVKGSKTVNPIQQNEKIGVSKAIKVNTVSSAEPVKNSTPLDSVRNLRFDMSTIAASAICKDSKTNGGFESLDNSVKARPRNEQVSSKKGLLSKMLNVMAESRSPTQAWEGSASSQPRTRYVLRNRRVVDANSTGASSNSNKSETLPRVVEKVDYIAEEANKRTPSPDMRFVSTKRGGSAKCYDSSLEPPGSGCSMTALYKDLETDERVPSPDKRFVSTRRGRSAKCYDSNLEPSGAGCNMTSVKKLELPPAKGSPEMPLITVRNSPAKSKYFYGHVSDSCPSSEEEGTSEGASKRKNQDAPLSEFKVPSPPKIPRRSSKPTMIVDSNDYLRRTIAPSDIFRHSRADESQMGNCIDTDTSLFIKGRKHVRARLVMRSVQSGTLPLTLQNDSIVPQVTNRRGSRYQSFVNDLIEQQIEHNKETTLLENTVCGGVTTKADLLQSITEHARKSIWNASFASRKPHAPSRANRESCAEATLQVMVEEDEDTEKESCVSSETIFQSIDQPEEATLQVITEECHDDSNISHETEKEDIDSLNQSSDIEEEKTSNHSSKIISESGESVDTHVEADRLSQDTVLYLCDQTKLLPIGDCLNEKTLRNCKKIGEGSYAEVFSYDSPTHGEVVLKIIPVEGDVFYNDGPQKKYEEMLNEIIITMKLSELRSGKLNKTDGFVKLISVRCMYGEFPEYLQRLWNDYDSRVGSENDNPDVFCDDQQYIVFELPNGGQDLEAFVFRNAKQYESAFMQATLSFAVAEKELEFEHRDFHWGNVLVAPTDEEKLSFTLDGKEIEIPTHGVKVAIIDFTLSRIQWEDITYFNDLALDPSLFTSKGEYQFDIYRMMRDETRNVWKSYRPKTNVFWLHYFLTKMNCVRFLRKSAGSSLRTLRNWEKRALAYEDSTELANGLFFSS